MSRSGGRASCQDAIRSLRIRLYNLVRQRPEISICHEVFKSRVWAKCRRSKSCDESFAIFKSDSVWNTV